MLSFLVSRLASALVVVLGVVCLVFMMIHAAQEPSLKRGVKKVELSWILENNKGMNDIIQSIGGRVYKTYRIYDKDLT